MFLKDILAISGHRGLFKYIKQGRNGVIVESLTDNKRMNAHASAKISSLEDITVFSEGDEDVQLEHVMKKIFEKENGGPAISHKAENEKLKAYFQDVFPEYDKDKVYVSDMKKIIMWYNILQELDMIKIVEEEENQGENPETQDQTKGDPQETATENADNA